MKRQGVSVGRAVTGDGAEHIGGYAGVVGELTLLVQPRSPGRTGRPRKFLWCTGSRPYTAEDLLC